MPESPLRSHDAFIGSGLYFDGLEGAGGGLDLLLGLHLHGHRDGAHGVGEGEADGFAVALGVADGESPVLPPCGETGEELSAAADGVSALTAHTTNRVPLILTAPGSLRDGGELADLAPTVISLLGLSQSVNMTDKDLLKHLQ